MREQPTPQVSPGQVTRPLPSSAVAAWALRKWTRAIRASALVDRRIIRPWLERES